MKSFAADPTMGGKSKHFVTAKIKNIAQKLGKRVWNYGSTQQLPIVLETKLSLSARRRRIIINNKTWLQFSDILTFILFID